MGDLNVTLPKTQKDRHQFVQNIITDTKALERMLQEQLFETDTIRIGAEQEFNLIDRHYKPAPVNLKVLEAVNDETYTTELARFNMECNIPPLEFKGKCLSNMEKMINKLLAKVRKVANGFDTDIILMGILPTIRKSDLDMNNLTPFERYKSLMQAILNLRGEDSMPLRIVGMDELLTKHDSPLLEACNTGFQVHLQVTPDDFTQKYNIAQAIAGPALAPATNSPILFSKRLWKETRIALFQQSVDTRITRSHLRDQSPRVMFGNNWVKKSVIELYKEDMLRFRVMLSSTTNENSLKILNNGMIPDLKALLVHNSTVYRWNRPCYGNAGGIPHLRIENRVLPAGPTVLDEMANAALWLGLLNGMGDHYPDITKVMDFDDAKANFIKVCRYGLDVTFSWVNGKKISARDLLKEELIPIAIEGLKKNKVDAKDIKRYTDVLYERVETRRTGAQWLLDSYAKLKKEATKEQIMLALTACTLKNQKMEKPVHQWDLASVDVLQGTEISSLPVEALMHTDVFSLHRKDSLGLAAEMMNTQRIRYVPVEDENGELVGLLTSSQLLGYFGKAHLVNKKKIKLIEDLMIRQPYTIAPHQTALEALKLMQEKKIGCLPVVQGKLLAGIVIEQDFLKLTGWLMQRMQDNNDKEDEVKKVRKVRK